MATSIYGQQEKAEPVGVASEELASEHMEDHDESQDCLDPPESAPAGDQMKIVQQAARDVRVLVSYLSRKRETLPTGFDFTIADRVLAGVYSQDLEQKLWSQLTALSALAHPATAESISDSRYYSVVYGEEKVTTSKSHRPLRIIQVLAFLAFLITFCLGIYAAVTGNIIDNARQLLTERTNIILERYQPTRLGAMVGSPILSGEPASSSEGETPPDSATTEESAAPPIPEPESQITEGEVDEEQPLEPVAIIPPDEPTPNWGEQPLEAGDKAITKTFLIQAALNQIRQEYAANAETLVRWNPMLPSTTAEAIVGEKFVADTGQEYALFGTVVFDQHLHMVRIITDFVIPMFAAFLGVAVYIIRDTAARRESVSLSPMDADGYIPRVILGLIAGLSIGWLTPPSSPVNSVDPQNASTLITQMQQVIDYTTAAASLSKTALAFVVGYSIEVLFNILDGFKAALGVRSDK